MLAAMLRGALALLLLGASLQAQFSDFVWTHEGDPAGSSSVSADLLHIVSPAQSACTSGETWAYLTTVAPASGTVSAHYFFDNQDGGFGWWTAEDPVYLVDGVVTFVGPGEFFDTWEGDVSFHVEAGQSFGFGVQSIDCDFGPGVLDVTDFLFAADVWQDLGHALPGSAGDPLLVGLGTLQPGTPFDFSLVDAQPLAPAWLFVGLATLNAPFKGGVLVPQPGPPGLLLGFTTSPAGRIVLAGNWPAGVPAGTLLVMQYWIVDAAGPAGFSASNAVSASAP